MKFIRTLAVICLSATAAVPAVAQDRRVPTSPAEVKLSYAPIVQRVQPAVGQRLRRQGGAKPQSAAR